MSKAAAKPLGLGLIGLHHQHPRWYHPLWSHLPQYRPLAVAEGDAEFLAAEKTFFGLDAYGDYRQVLDRRDVDVVIIWLPHSKMPQAVVDAAEAGKHVIVEKPCSSSVDGARRMLEVSRRHPKIKITAPYCWRTHPVSGEIRRAVDAGMLGEIVAMEGRLNAGGAHRYVTDHATWMLQSAERGGPMWNLGVHWVDYFRWMTGRRVMSVCGQAVGPKGDPPRDIEDSAQAILKFEGGATAMLDISYCLPASYPGKRDIYVSLRGRLGGAAWAPAWEGTTDELLLVSEHPSVAPRDRCRKVRVESKSIPGYCGHMAWAFLADFASAIAEDRPPLVTPQDIFENLKVVDAFYRSLRTGRFEPVEAL